METFIFTYCSQDTGQRYRNKIGKVLGNIRLLKQFPECSNLFFQKKIDVSKLKTNLDKFRSTCIKLEEKVRRSKPSPTSSNSDGMASSKGKSDQIKA